MELPFWSIYKACGVTSNLTAIGIMGVLLGFDYNITLAENHLNINNLGNRILFSYKNNEVKEENFCDLRYCRRLSDTKIEILKSKLFYIPPIQVKKDYFEMNFYYNVLPQIREKINEREIIMIDTDYSCNLTSPDILDKSEMVIVNLCQDIFRTNIFLEEYSSISDKAVFIISQYKQCRLNEVKKLLINYGISIDRISIIPYNEEFHFAMKEGRSVEFIRNNYNCKKGTANYYFIIELKRATRMIMKHVDLLLKK